MLRYFPSGSFFSARMGLGLIASVCLSWSVAHSLPIRGRLTADFYSYESAGQTYNRPYIGLRATTTAWRGQRNETLSIYSNVRYRGDLSDKSGDYPQIFVYDAYAHLRGIPKGGDIYLGRQFVYTTVGSAMIDGAKIKYRYGQRLEVEAFGGSRVKRLDPEMIRSLSESGVLGARVGYKFPRKIRFGLMWMESRSRGDLAYQRAGLEVEKLLNRGRLYSRLTMNVIDRKPDEFVLRATRRPGPWYLAAELSARKPSVAANTLFSMIDFSRRQMVRLDLHRTFYHNLTVVTQAQVSFLDDDKSWTTTLGLRNRYGMIAWYHQDGDTGDRNGWRGYLNFRYTRQLEFYASANYSRYRVQAAAEDRIDAHSASVGSRWRLANGLSLGLEGQYLQNASAQEDFRILFRLAKNFNLGSLAGKR